MLDEGFQWLELLLAAEMEERGLKPLTLERTQRRAKGLQAASLLAWLIGEHAKSGKLSAESRQLYQSLGPDGKVGYAYACLRYDPMANATEGIWVREQALAILREAGDRFMAGEMLGRLGWLALSCNEYERAKAYFDENLALRKEISDLEGLAGALYEQSNLAFYKGEIKGARKWLEESIRILNSLHNVYYLGILLLSLCEIDTVEGRYAQAVTHAREALSIGRRQGAIALIHGGFLHLGRIALIQGDYPQATEWFEQNLAYCRKKNHKTYITEALCCLGLFAWDKGEGEQAAKLYTEALINCQEESGDRFNEGFIIYHLGKVSIAQGEVRQARANFKEALEAPVMFLGQPLLLRNVNLSTLALEGIAAMAAEQAQATAAARLMGATEAWHQRFFYTRLPRERLEREACIAALRDGMGEQAFAAAWAEGQAMSQEQAVAYAKGLFHSEP